jgi:hypothetical protein
MPTAAETISAIAPFGHMSSAIVGSSDSGKKRSSAFRTPRNSSPPVPVYSR